MTGAIPDPAEVEIEVEVDLGPRALSLVRPAHPDSLIDEEAFAADEYLPYWAELWPSGLALARHVTTVELSGRRVLELGCGLGLPSLAASLGGADAVATDWSRDAVALLERNAARNGVRLEALVADWRDAGPLLALGPFDLVLAADVLYEARNVEPLLSLLGALAAPALVADPGRRHADAFRTGAAAAGWQATTLSDELVPRGGIHRLARPHDLG